MRKAPPPGRTFADKLDHLFGAVRRSTGQEFSYEEVATKIVAHGVTISQSYIWQLRKGHKDNPTFKHLQALANFFGVPPRTSSTTTSPAESTSSWRPSERSNHASPKRWARVVCS